MARPQEQQLCMSTTQDSTRQQVITPITVHQTCQEGLCSGPGRGHARHFKREIYGQGIPQVEAACATPYAE